MARGIKVSCLFPLEYCYLAFMSFIRLTESCEIGFGDGDEHFISCAGYFFLIMELGLVWDHARKVGCVARQRQIHSE